MNRRLNGRFLLILVAVAAALGVGGYFLHGLQVKQSAGLLLARAEKAEEDGKVDDAVTYFGRYLVLRPDDAPVRGRRGLLLAGKATTRRDKVHALVVLEAALRDAPDQPKARRKAAELAIDLGQYTDAKVHIDELLRARPTDPDLLELMGRCEEEGGQSVEAIERYRLAIDAAPDRVSAYVRLAALYRRQNRTDEATEVMNRLGQANPTSVRAKLARVRFFRSLEGADNLRTAQADLRAAEAQGGKDDKDLLLAAADLALADKAVPEAQRWADARAKLKRGLELYPTELDFALALSAVESQAGRPAEAAAVLRGAVANVPADKPEYLWEIADRLITVDDPAGALEVMARFRKVRVDPAPVDYLEARLRARDGRAREAADLLLRCRPEFVRAPLLALQTELLLVWCYERLGAPEQRLAAAERAIQIDGTSVLARQAKGDALLALGRVEDAVAEYRVVLNQPEAAGLRLKVARIRIYQNALLPADRRDFAEAAALLDSAPDAVKQTADYYLLRTELLIAQRRVDDARKALQEAREKTTDVRFWLLQADLDAQQDGPKAGLALLKGAEAKLGNRVVELWVARAGFLAALDPPDVAAIKALEAGVADFPEADRDRLLSGLAEAYVRARARPEAEAALQRLADRTPHDPAVLGRWLEVLFERGADPGKLQPVVDRLRRAEGDDGAAWVFADAYLHWQKYRAGNQAGDLAQAQASLALAAKRRPKWSRVPALAGEIADHTGKIEAAIEKYQQAVELGARSPELARRLVQLLTARRRFDEAREVFDKVQGRAPLPDDLKKLQIGVDLARPGAAREAAVEQAERVAKGSKEFRDHLWLAQVYWSSDKPKEAEAAYRKAVEVAPAAAEPRVALVVFLARTGRAKDARAETDRAARELTDKAAAAALAPCYEALGDRPEAEKRYVALATESPNDLGVQRSLAAFYLSGGEVAKARPVLNRLIAQAGAEAAGARRWARRSLALALASSGEYADGTAALDHLNANLTEQPGNPEDTRALALILATRPGGRRQSIQTLEDSFRVLRPTAGEEFLLAQLYDLDNDWAKASGRMEALLNGPEGNNPTFTAWYVRALLRRKDPATAVTYLGRLEANEKEAKAPRTVELKARLLAAQDRKSEAADLLRVFAREAYMAKGNPVVLQGAGLILAELKLPAEAEDVLKQYVREAEAKTPTAPLVLAEFYAHQNRPADALGVCERALPTAGPEPTARCAVGVVRVADLSPADVARAEAVVTRAVQSRPDSLDLQISLADLRDAQGNYAAAKQIYRAVLTKEPRNQLALNNLGWLLAVEEGKPQDADRMLTEAIKYYGPVANLLDTRGMARLKAGKTEEAIADLSEAVAQTADPQLYFHLALAHHKAGNLRDAERNMRKVVELDREREFPVRRQLHKFEVADFEAMILLVEAR